MTPVEPLSEAVALQAAEWFVQLQAGTVSAAERRRWVQWHAAHPSHAVAWERALRVGQAFEGLPAAVALPALNRPRRRAVVRTLAALLVAAPAGWLAWRHGAAVPWLADARTATGERREIRLADGSVLLLDTASAVDMTFDATQRLVRLRAGAVHITTVPDPQPGARPFVVATAHGRLRALGTRFTVRLDGARTRVAVFEGAVALEPVAVPDGGATVRAGEQAEMTAQAVAAIGAVAAQADAWTRGVLQARGMRLADFAAELGRYRPGLLRCDPRVAEVRISGVFQLRDTTAVLDGLPQALPVRVVYRSPYWVILMPPGG